MKRIRIGSRADALSIAQARRAAAQLPACEVVTVEAPEAALESGQVDVVARSLKDIRSTLPDRFTLAAFLMRGDARDAWVSRSGCPIYNVRPGTVVGTSSPRRRAQVIERYPHLRIRPLYGDVESRIRNIEAGAVDGGVISAAALHCLGRHSAITSYFRLDQMVPAAGQAIVALQVLASRTDVGRACRELNHAETEQAALAERAVLQQFDGKLDCESPLAVHASLDGTLMTIHAYAGGLRAAHVGFDPSRLARSVYRDLVDNGALELLATEVM